MKRKIINIDEKKCNGCGLCIPDCPEGALQIIEGKARLVSDLFCDGLGACLGSCPQDAISTEEREAEPYDEKKVMEENIIPKGIKTINAHLQHLNEHGEKEHLKKAIEVLEEKGIKTYGGHEKKRKTEVPCGCPSAKETVFKQEEEKPGQKPNNNLSPQLRQWPVQLQLLSPSSSFLKGADVILAADCSAYSHGNFHNRFLRGKSIAIACPKLDSGTEEYIEKIRELADTAMINTLEVIIMEVPCCRGLFEIAREGLKRAARKVPMKLVILGIKGDIVKEEWI